MIFYLSGIPDLGRATSKQTPKLCRITHKESGIITRGADGSSRVENQRDAFRVANLPGLKRYEIITQRETKCMTRRQDCVWNIPKS